MLSGETGEGTGLAMRLVIRAAEVLGADRLIPITRAHVDACLYHGEASLDFARRLAAGGTQVAAPTTLNVGSLDLLHPELWRGEPEAAERGRLLMEVYRQIGCRPSFTCTPYQIPDARPELGEQVAWAESNAIVFCNSVIGARTNRYGDFIDVACAVTGRVPDAGLHRTDLRRGRLLLRLAADIPAALMEDDSLYPVLGIVLGRRAGGTVAVLDGLPEGLSEDRLKGLGAAAASSGPVAMFHAIGSTPEAPTPEAAFQRQQPDAVEEIAFDELRKARAELTGADARQSLRAVSLGTPHASLAELANVADLLADSRPASGTEFLVSTARGVLAAAEKGGLANRLRASGVELLVDTCSYIAPVLRPGHGAVMTDSGKWAYYAPGNIGADVVFGTTAECVASAVAGRVVRFASAWDSA
jgi:predicted aconitase